MKRKTYSGLITKLNRNQIFVFGSNPSGLHGMGTARIAFFKYGAKWNIGSMLNTERDRGPASWPYLGTRAPQLAEPVGRTLRSGVFDVDRTVEQQHSARRADRLSSAVERARANRARVRVRARPAAPPPAARTAGGHISTHRSASYLSLCTNARGVSRARAERER